MTVAAPAGASKVPYDDFPCRYRDWAERIVELVREVARSDEFILKSGCRDLEAAIAAHAGVAHAVGVSNGTAALMLSLLAIGIGPGDEVLTPAFSFVSSASAVALVGAKPVFVDVADETWVLDPQAAAAAATPATRAVIPVHLFGHLADMRALGRLARARGLWVVEDSAVSLGALLDDSPVGSHGDAGVFSFFPGKPLGGIGDGGMVVTSDVGIAARCRMLRNHGQEPAARFLHHAIGFNARMDELVARFLLLRLPGLGRWLERRRELATRYNGAFGPLAPVIRTPPLSPDAAVYSYVIRCARRAGLIAHLTRRGVGTRVYYPRALPQQPAFAGLRHRAGEFPVAEALARECVALPLHPEMTDAQVELVIDAVREFAVRSL